MRNTADIRISTKIRSFISFPSLRSAAMATIVCPFGFGELTTLDISGAQFNSKSDEKNKRKLERIAPSWWRGVRLSSNQ